MLVYRLRTFSLFGFAFFTNSSLAWFAGRQKGQVLGLSVSDGLAGSGVTAETISAP
jgi:hypothetical protein